MLLAVWWLIVLSAALFTAYSTARRLFQKAVLEAAAATILIWMVLAIAGLLYAGILRGFTPFVSGAAILVFCAGTLLLARRLTPVTAADHAPPSHVDVSRTEAAALLLLGVMLVLGIAYRVIPMMDEMRTGTFPDVIVFEIPTIVNYVHARSVWDFGIDYPFYPYNYHLLFAIGFWLTSSYALNPFVQIIPLVGMLLYTVLIGLDALQSKSLRLNILVGLLIANGTLFLRSQEQFVWNVGKNDGFIGMIVLAAIHYWTQYWRHADEDQPARLALLGLALGVGMGSKFTVSYWIAVFAILHGIMLIRKYSWRVWQWWRLAVRHVLLVGVPILLLAGPWFIRTGLGYKFTSEDAWIYQFSMDTALINLLGHPYLRAAAAYWLPPLVVLIVGMLLVIGFRTPKVKGLPVAFAGLLLVLFISGQLLLGGYYSALVPATLVGMLALGLLLVIGAWLRPALISERLGHLGAWVFLSGVLLILTPLSGLSFLGPGYVFIQYRFQPTLMILAVPALVLLALAVLRREPLLKAQGSARQPIMLALPPDMLGPALATGWALIMVAGVWRSATYHTLVTVPEYTTPVDSGIYRWVIPNVRGAVILADRSLVPYLLYGDDLSNRVIRYDSRTADPDDLTALVMQSEAEYLIVPSDRETAVDQGCAVPFQDQYYKVIDLTRCPDSPS